MAMPARSLDRVSITLMLVICFSLGFNQVAAKVALVDVPPLVQAALRSAAATIILGFGASWYEPQLYARDRTLWPGLILGFFFSLEFAGLFLGLQFTTASHAVLFLYTAPFFVALGLRLFVPDERLRALQWGGMLLSFIGVADAEMVISQMQVWQGFKLLGDQTWEVLNGQTIKFSSVVERAFTGGIQRESAVGLGFQPKVEKLEEGIVLKFSPLLTYEGDTLEAAIELSTNLVRKLHPVKVLAPREIGPAELNLDVPEVSETRLNQPVKNWPLGETLIMSAGIQPGILMDKGGLFNMKIPGTVPTSTELLVVVNVEIPKKPARERNS